MPSAAPFWDELRVIVEAKSWGFDEESLEVSVSPVGEFKIQAKFCAKALERGILPPTINLENPDPECDLDYVPKQAREQRINAFANNSFGFGGHNATVIGRRFEG